MQLGFGLSRCISKKHKVIYVVYVCKILSVSGYFFFFSVKLFSFIISIDVRSTESRLIINKYGINISIYKTSATMSKKSVSKSSNEFVHRNLEIFLYELIK